LLQPEPARRLRFRRENVLALFDHDHIPGAIVRLEQERIAWPRAVEVVGKTPASGAWEYKMFGFAQQA
jgi:hypothetical protein